MTWAVEKGHAFGLFHCECEHNEHNGDGGHIWTEGGVLADRASAEEVRRPL